MLQNNKGELIYLASPYTHKDLNIQEERYQKVLVCAADLIQSGFYIYSPIIHNHHIAKIANLPIGFNYWKAFDLFMLQKCDGLLIYCLPGWQKSVGIKGEIEYATKELGIKQGKIITIHNVFYLLYAHEKKED